MKPPAAPSLHRRILDDIGARIVSGEWPPGYRIPYEHELTARYGCSRMTVSKALGQLARAGLIERRKRSGSFVARPRSQAAVMEIHDIRAEVETLGMAYAYRLLSRAIRGAVAGDALDIAEGAPILALVCLHMARDVPFCLETRLIALDAVPEARDEAFDTEAPGPWLISHVPWSEAEHVIRAVGADHETARLLALETGDPCLVVDRKTWTGDRPVTAVRLTYPGGGHSLTARFAPEGTERRANS